MKVKRVLVILLGVLLFAGCVSSQKYRASLNDISNLKKDVTALEEKLRAKEAEKAGLESEISKLKGVQEELTKKSEMLSKKQEELAGKHETLSKDHEELTKKSAALSEENANLKSLLEAKKDELTKEIVSVRAKLSENEQKVKNIDEELKSKQSENALRTKGLEDELKSKNMQIAELKTEIEGLSHERSKAIEEKEQAIAELNKTYTNLVTELNDEIKKGEIAVTQLRDKLSVSLVEKILFDSGSAEIKKDGKKVLDRVAEILKKISDKQIRIEGHTDNVPIGYRIAKKFSTNWELSTARATTVVRYLQEKNIDPKLLNPAGYAEYKPVESNDTEEGKARNRRIEIVLIPMDIDRLKR